MTPLFRAWRRVGSAPLRGGSALRASWRCRFAARVPALRAGGPAARDGGSAPLRGGSALRAARWYPLRGYGSAPRTGRGAVGGAGPPACGSCGTRRAVKGAFGVATRCARAPLTARRVPGGGRLWGRPLLCGGRCGWCGGAAKAGRNGDGVVCFLLPEKGWGSSRCLRRAPGLPKGVGGRAPGAGRWVAGVRGVAGGSPRLAGHPSGYHRTCGGDQDKPLKRSRKRDPGRPHSPGDVAELPGQPRGAPAHRVGCGGGPPPTAGPERTGPTCNVSRRCDPSHLLGRAVGVDATPRIRQNYMCRKGNGMAARPRTTRKTPNLERRTE